MLKIQKATKASQKLKLLLQGTSGSGKTYSSLILATEIAKKFNTKIIYVDTENGSASLYSDKFDFDVVELTNHSVNSYIETMQEIKNLPEYGVVVIDSITHEWNWVLEQVSASTKGYPQNWKAPTEAHDRFLKCILMFNKHLICTTRAKQSYETQDIGGGKKVVQKMGLAPIQREGIEYEFTTAFMIDSNNRAEVSKDRTGLFAKNELNIINKDTAKLLTDWLENSPTAEQLEFLQQAKETLDTTIPNTYIDYINNGELCRKITNAELLLELKEYSFDKATSQGYSINSNKTSFVKNTVDEIEPTSQAQPTKPTQVVGNQKYIQMVKAKYTEEVDFNSYVNMMKGMYEVESLEAMTAQQMSEQLNLLNAN